MLIKNEEDLRKIASSALNVQQHEIEAALTNNQNIQDSAFDVLRNWMRQQNGREEAYTNLYLGLQRIGAIWLIDELARRQLELPGKNLNYYF